ncbi:hypothetical protein VaNZ11_007238 [Volvox africanus]|uniref:Uncharacterized protein n=1 Tax=Volvox africanus TaxID=51714 RepID=A0ABQ5S422_9CHLO|nr:hypothetical protein VaNZ11_007238 [Volvox africanus]
MGQCVSHAGRDSGGEERKPTTAQRISTWPEVPGPMPTTGPKSPVSATLTGGGGLALNVRPSCRTADLSKSPRKDGPLAIIYAHDPGKPTARPSKSKALTAVLALQEPCVNGATRAAALGAAAARAAAATTAASGACSSCSGSGKADVGCGGGNCDAKAVTNIHDAEFSLSRQSPITATELREISYFARSSRGLNPDEDTPEDDAGESPPRKQPVSTRPGPGRGPERAWMETEAEPGVENQSLQQPDLLAAASGGAGQVDASPAGPTAAVEQTPADGSCTEGCSVLGRKSSHFSTPCQDLDGHPEQWPVEVAQLMKSNAEAAAAVAAVAVAAAAAAVAAAAAARSSSQPKPAAAIPVAVAQTLQGQEQSGMESPERHDGNSTSDVAPTLAAGGSHRQLPPNPKEIMTIRDGKGCEETTGGGGASTNTGISSAGGAGAGAGATAPLGGRWASRLAQGIPPSLPLAQQQEQQREGSSRSAAAETVTDWSSTRELSRNSGNGDYLNLTVQQQGELPVVVAHGSGNYRVSAPGSSNPLLWRPMINRVKAATAAAGISTASTRTAQALVEDIAVQSGKNGTLGPRSDSGMNDPARNPGRLAAARPGARGPGIEPEALEVQGCSGGSEHHPGSGASGRRYEHLEVAEADGEVNSYVPSSSSKATTRTEGARGIGGGNAGGGRGGSKASGGKWTPSRAGKTLAMFRMQAAARRVAEETEKQKQSREQERERLEYVPQASLQRRVCTPPPTPSAQRRDEDTENDAGDADPLPYEDGICGARMANGPPPSPLSLQHQQQLQQDQEQRLEVWAGAQGTSSSPADVPYARQAGLLARKVVSERVIWPRSHTVSSRGDVGPPPAADEPPLYAVPGSTEPVPVRGPMPGTQNGAPAQPPPLPPGQLPQHHTSDSSSQNTLWLYPQLPRQCQPQGPAPPAPPPQQQVHSSPLLKASSSMQQRPPSSGRAVNTQLSLGHQARNYFQMVSKLRDRGLGSPDGGGGAGRGRGTLGPEPAAITGSSDRGICAPENIVRRSMYGGQLPEDDITSDRTMRLYPYPATTAKAAALMSKQQSGKQIVTAVMPKAEMITPPPTPPPFPLSPSLSPSALRSPTQQLQRKDSRLGARISEGGVAGPAPGPAAGWPAATPGGVAGGAGPDITLSSPVGSYLNAEKHELSQDVQQLEPTPPGLVGKRISCQVRTTSKTPCENDLPCGSSEGDFIASRPAVDKSRSYRHSEPYWPSAEALQPQQELSPPRALTPQATVAPHPIPRTLLSLPGLLLSEEDQRKESERVAFAATIARIGTQVETTSKAAHSVTPLPPPRAPPPPPPPPAPPQLLPLSQPIMAIGIPAQTQYHAYAHRYQPQSSYQPYIVYQPYIPEGAPVLVPQK